MTDCRSRRRWSKASRDWHFPSARILDGDKAANRYVTADGVGTWGNVVSVKAQLLLATVRDNVTTSPQAYTFDSVTTTPTDKRLRTVLSSVITVRNRAP